MAILQGQDALDWMKSNPGSGYSTLDQNNNVQSNVEGDKGWLGNILYGFAKPFLNAGRIGGQIGQDVLGGLTNGRISSESNQALTGEEQKNMPEFLAKTAAGIGANAVGGGGGLLPLAAGGALQSYSNQQLGTPLDVGGLIKGAAVGGGTGLALEGAGGVLQSMKNNAIAKAGGEATDTVANEGENLLQKAEPMNSGENIAKDMSAEHPNNVYRTDNAPAQNAFNDFYTRSGKGTLDLEGNKGVVPAGMEANIKDNVTNLEDYRLNLKDAGNITDNKITPENIGKIQDAAGSDISSKVKNIDDKGLIQQQSALSYIDNSTKSLTGIDNQEALKQADDLVKEFRISKDGPLTAEDYKAIKQGTDGFSQKYNKLDLTQQQAFANKNKVALALNDSSRKLLIEADPTLQKSLQTYSFIQQNAPDLKKAFIGNMQNNIVAPRLTKGGLLRTAINKVQDINKQGLIDQASGGAEQGAGILGRIKSTAGNIPLPAVNAPQGLINTLRNPLVQKGTGTLLNMTPQGTPQAISDAQNASGTLKQQQIDNIAKQKEFDLAQRAIQDRATPAQLQSLGINIPGLTTSAAQTKAAELQQAKDKALQVVQQAEKMSQGLNLGSGILGKLTGSVSNALPSPDVKAYNAFVSANAPILAKAFGVNATSKTAMANFINALPSPTDTAEEAQAKLQALYTQLQD